MLSSMAVHYGAFVYKDKWAGCGARNLLLVASCYQQGFAPALTAANLRDRVRVLVGGAPVTQQWAEEIGADGFAPNTSAAVALARRLVAA